MGIRWGVDLLPPEKCDTNDCWAQARTERKMGGAVTLLCKECAKKFDELVELIANRRNRVNR